MIKKYISNNYIYLHTKFKLKIKHSYERDYELIRTKFRNNVCDLLQNLFFVLTLWINGIVYIYIILYLYNYKYINIYYLLTGQIDWTFINNKKIIIIIQIILAYQIQQYIQQL